MGRKVASLKGLSHFHENLMKDFSVKLDCHSFFFFFFFFYAPSLFLFFFFFFLFALLNQ